VQHPIVPIEELSRSSSGVNELSVEVSEALRMSLSEVCDLYFEDKDEVEVNHIIEEEREHR
jgi:hypothetical protein